MAARSSSMSRTARSCASRRSISTPTTPSPGPSRRAASSSRRRARTTLAPHGQNYKSVVYSPDRLLYPMKRVDFDPDGARNPQNRGKSGYERISWAEALDLVAGEIKRLKSSLWARRDGGVARLAPHLGQYRLLPLGAASLQERRRPHRRPSQSRQLGRLVLGRGASLGPLPCASARARPTARSRTASRTAT